MRCNGIPLPSVTSGAVTSIPSFTRKGRPSFSFSSSPPAGRTWAALRVSSARPIGAGLYRYNLPLLVPRSARKQAPAKPRRRIRKLRLLGFLLILSFLGLASFTFGMITALASQMSALDPVRCQRQEADGFVYAGAPSKRVLAVLRGSESRIIVTPEDISDRMKHAIVAVEDRRFYEHRGVDIHAIARAIWADVRHEKVVEGGSTITQQFV